MIPEHHHPEDQLVFASKGVMTIYTRAGIWVVPPLRGVWIPAGTPHRIAMSGAVSMRTLYFRSKLIAAMPRKCVVINVSPLLRELILHACSISRLTKRSPGQRRIIEMIGDLLKESRSAALQLPLPSDPRAHRVAERLVAEPGQRETLEDLCRKCGASKRTVHRTFVAETNLTFGKWRQQLRLLHALQLLSAGHKITAVAMDSGYDSPSAFIAMFKKQLGTTPMRYFES
jgi:AraC-like DNA-binding protein